MQRWTRFKSRYLIDFTNELTAKVRAIRGPQVQTARNIFAEPMLNPDSEAWYAQNLDDFLGTYDWTAPMAMPLMEKQTHDSNPAPGLKNWSPRSRLAPARSIAPCSNCRHGTGRNRTDADIDGEQLAEWMSVLKRQGATSFGYYPDNFLDNLPDLKAVRPALSNKWNP